MVKELYIEKDEATAIKYIMNHYTEITDLFSVCGYLRTTLPAAAERKLRHFEDKLDGLFPGPTNTPRNDTHSAMIFIDALMGTYGVEGMQFKNKDDDRIDLDYCNAGDTYAATLCFSTADDAFCLGCWGDFVEEFEAQGYYAVESYDIR